MAVMVESSQFQELFKRAIASGILPDRQILEWSWRHNMRDVSTVTVTYIIENSEMAEFLNPTKETA